LGSDSYGYIESQRRQVTPEHRNAIANVAKIGLTSSISIYETRGFTAV